MRKYAILENPLKCNRTDSIYKIMLHQTKTDVFLYMYCSPDAVLSSFDACYHDVQSVYETWNDEIDERGWIDIADPLPDCQCDAFLPIRVKGRNTSIPQWGQFEIFKNGQWVDCFLTANGCLKNT